MTAGYDRRELDIRASSEVEVVVPVAQGEAARFLAQSKEQSRAIGALANRNNDVPAITIQLKIDIRRGDRTLTERQTRFILQSHVEQQFRRRSTLSRKGRG